jgi:signal transduction histidine kinase
MLLDKRTAHAGLVEDEADGDVARPQEALAELGRAALDGRSLQAVLDYASVLVVETLDLDFCGILELVAGEDSLALRAGAGWREGRVGDLTAGFEHDVHRGGSVVIHRRDPSDGEMKPWGLLDGDSQARRAFTADDLNFLNAVANTLGLAIDCRAGEQELRRMTADALEAEHRAHERISQLLHDEVLQSLLAARQDLAEADAPGTATDGVVARAREAVAAAIGELRNVVVALHPVTVEQRGLTSAIEATADFHAAGGGFEVSLSLAPESDGEWDQLIVSLAQELLSNIAQHAEARHVTIVLRRLDESLLFEIADDGRGMDPERAAEALDQGRIGLASIARRVESLGGRFDLMTDRGKGTRARVLLPADLQTPTRG